MKTDGNYKEKENIFNIIRPEDAMYVLAKLIRDDSQLKDKAYKIMMKRLKEIDNEDIASDVYNSLDCLDVEDLWNRSGKTRYGYVEPSEESWVMIEEEIYPFLNEMKKYQELGMHQQAKTYCIGIIKGLKRYESESNSEFVDWAVDAFDNYIDETFEEYKNSNPNKEDISNIESIINNYET